MANEFEEVSWPGWEIVRKISEGSFGSVYEIQRTLPGGRIEKCALKKLTVPQNEEELHQLYARGFSTKNIAAHYRSQMSELVNEYSLNQVLNGCKNVVTCYDIRYVQHTDGIGWDIFIRMELLRTMQQALDSKYREDLVLRLGIGICDALIACQKHKIIHRDIKPENILVSEEGDFKLGDFGIAKNPEKAAAGTLTGTYGYMAPEVANRRNYGFGADIYSLGMVLYWMMNELTLPFLPLPPTIPSANTHQEAVNRRLAGESLPPPVNGSQELKQIVLTACAFTPEERYHSARDFRRGLIACYQHQRAEHRSEQFSTPSPIVPKVLTTNRPPCPDESDSSLNPALKTAPLMTSFRSKKEKRQRRITAILLTIAFLLAALGVAFAVAGFLADSRRETTATSQTQTRPAVEADLFRPLWMPRLTKKSPAADLAAGDLCVNGESGDGGGDCAAENLT